MSFGDTDLTDGIDFARKSWSWFRILEKTRQKAVTQRSVAIESGKMLMRP